ncbi:MAG: AEC family transporter [Luteolibacter sp.]
MISTLLTILPVFALIFIGWCVRRRGLLGPHATGELNRFVVYLALPALLFDIVSRARLSEIWQPGFIATFGLSCFLLFALTLAFRWWRSKHLADSAIDALGAAYANTGFLGFPLALAVFGPEAMAPTLIATILTVCAIFAVAIVAIEVGLQKEQRLGRLAWKTSGSLARNPLLLAPLLGAVFPIFELPVPAAIGSLAKLLGGAASPCALVGLGLFLAEKRQVESHQCGPATVLIACKLLVQPLAAWWLATQVFRLPGTLPQQAVLLAALPTGTGPFMLAEFYHRHAAMTSRIIIVSTALSVMTLAIYITYGIR